MARLSILTAVGALAARAVAASIRRFDSLEPFYEHDAGVPADCNLWWNSDDGFTCETALLIAGVSVDELTRLRLGVGQVLLHPIPLCPTGGGDLPGPSSTNVHLDSPKCHPTPTQPPNGVETPSPAQPGMVDDCNRFHQVQRGDTCGAVATNAGVTVAQLAQWNKEIGGIACTGIWVDYYICTGVEGGSPTQPPPADTTPQPVQEGMVDDCKKFHFVQSGQNCDGISRQYGISLANFLRWNPAAGSDCRGLWANTYVCVGL